MQTSRRTRDGSQGALNDKTARQESGSTTANPRSRCLRLPSHVVRALRHIRLGGFTRSRRRQLTHRPVHEQPRRMVLACSRCLLYGKALAIKVRHITPRSGDPIRCGESGQLNLVCRIASRGSRPQSGRHPLVKAPRSRSTHWRRVVAEEGTAKVALTALTRVRF